jgi:probable rRNA maturation factor
MDSTVEISLEDVEEPPWQNAAAAFAKKVLRALGHGNWDLSLRFTNNAAIKNLNRQYRNIDEPTDVLSFTLGEISGGRCLPGDIVISLDALEENARAFSVSSDEELRRLIIHGILHLDGMDHITNGADEPMLVKQETLLAELADHYIISGAGGTGQ